MRYKLTGNPVNAPTFYVSLVCRAILAVVALFILAAVLPFSVGEVFAVGLAALLLSGSRTFVLTFSD